MTGCTVRVQAQEFDVGGEAAALLAACPDAGAVASFLGVVRSTPDHPIAALTLEHYPAMTQAAIERIAAQAGERFGLRGGTVSPRGGRRAPRAPIVLVLAAARHRQAALDAAAYLIDWLKTAAPFWKREEMPDGSSVWVEARDEDDVAAARW